MFKKNKQEKKYELILIFLYFLFAAFLSLSIKANYLVSIFLFAGIPSLYLSIRNPKIIKKTILYSFFAGLPITFLTDYLAHVSHSWYEPSVIGVRVLNTFPIDLFIWAFFYIYFIVAFYEYFFDKDRNKKNFSHNTKYLFLLVASLLSIFGIIYSLNKELLVVRYFYIIFIVTAFIIPSVLVLYRYPRLLKKIVLQGLYFFVLSIIVEFTALQLGQWFFIGNNYIGFIEIFKIRFPLEELLWLIFAVPAYLCLYEYFADDRK